MAKSPSDPAARRAWLDKARTRLDDLNDRLLRLLSARAEIVREIGRLKEADGAAVYQPAREREIIERMIAENPGPLADEHVRRIFTEVISACRALERELRVAFLGPEHTYAHEAAVRHFGTSVVLAPESSIAAVFQAVDGDRADLGVVPVENSTEGSVGLTLDLLIDTALAIVGEVLLPVRHAIASRDGDAPAVRRVVSHQQSLAQCRGYLAANYPNAEQEAFASNARAAQWAAEHPECAAIASPAAARFYGLKLIAENIQDSPHNTTRFLVIGRHPVARSGADKTSVLFAVAHKVGALNAALAVFARNRINISKIESRPLRARAWEYLFFADLAGHRDEPRLRRALVAFEREVLFLKVLGSYPEGR